LVTQSATLRRTFPPETLQSNQRSDPAEQRDECGRLRNRAQHNIIPRSALVRDCELLATHQEMLTFRE
jgi:hypothetical protein